MIETIKIKNYALIEDSEIELGSGLNIITGETGAGKSLFINALSLIMGEKVSLDVVGKNGNEAIIESIIKPNELLLKRLRSINIEVEDSFIIKRVIGQKNRCYINGSIVSLSQLKEVMKGFLEICSQHENQSLLKEDYQIDILDKYLELESDLIKIKESFSNLKKIEKEKEEINLKNNDLLNKKDYLEYQLEEIESYKLTKEDENLDEIISKLKNDVKIKELESLLFQNLFSQNGVKNLLKESFYLIKELDSFLNKNTSDKFKEKFEDFNSFLDSLPKNPTSIDEELVDYYLKRNDSLEKIKRKHGSVNNIFLKKCEIESELSLLDNFDENIKNIDIEIEKHRKNYISLANKISSKRKDGAKKLSNKIEDNLKDLNIPFAKFKIEILSNTPTEKGIDKVSFMISPNRSEDLKELNKIASGGELSRIILSIYNSITQNNKSLLFDEVDSGIGGDTAPKIGEKLKDIGKNCQVICITHLPQVAVFGDFNYKIEKIQDKNKTISKIFKLNENLFKEEISRMLGSSLTGNMALNNAIEMIKSAKKIKQ